jgi:SAM-dependent methyltransferase
VEVTDKQQKDYFDLRQITPDFYSAYTIPSYMAKVLPDDRSRKILDVGCGFGQTMNALKSLGYENVRGVDISDEAVRHCKTLGLHVDKISDIAVIPFVASIKAMLRTEGQFLIMVPNAQANTDCYWAYEDFTHSTLFTAGSLYFVLRAGGFQEITVVDPYCIEGLSYAKRKVKLFLLKMYTANKLFWNRVTGSSYHKPSPIVFSYEIKVLAK